MLRHAAVVPCPAAWRGGRHAAAAWPAPTLTPAAFRRRRRHLCPTPRSLRRPRVAAPRAQAGCPQPGRVCPRARPPCGSAALLCHAHRWALLLLRMPRCLPLDSPGTAPAEPLFQRLCAHRNSAADISIAPLRPCAPAAADHKPAALLWSSDAEPAGFYVVVSGVVRQRYVSPEGSSQQLLVRPLALRADDGLACLLLPLQGCGLCRPAGPPTHAWPCLLLPCPGSGLHFRGAGRPVRLAPAGPGDCGGAGQQLWAGPPRLLLLPRRCGRAPQKVRAGSCAGSPGLPVAGARRGRQRLRCLQGTSQPVW